MDVREAPFGRVKGAEPPRCSSYLRVEIYERPFTADDVNHASFMVASARGGEKDRAAKGEPRGGVA